MKDPYMEGIKNNDHRWIAKAITLLESTRKEDRKKSIDLLSRLLKEKKPKTTMRIGISGIPGVGKSTFLESLGSYILNKDAKMKIAILSIDPTSPLEGGSILADRIRMETLSKSANVFIRPSPNTGIHGGVSRRTRESILLLESAGYDIIFIETVGVGQSEFHIASLVDLFLLLQMPSTGDDWQAMKKGILELADLVIVNKTDGALEKEAKALRKTLELSLPKESQKGNKLKVLCTSAKLKTGFDTVWEEISAYFSKEREKTLHKTRKNQDLFWFYEELFALFKNEVQENTSIQDALMPYREDVLNHGALFSEKSSEALTIILKTRSR